MKILLADDHALFREGIKQVLKLYDQDLETIEATDCAEVLKIVSEQSDLDIVLLDLTMPDVNGLEIVGQIQDLLPGISVVILSATEDPRVVREAIDAGAKGFIPKSSTHQVMHSALELIISGGIYLPPSLLEYPAQGNKDDTIGINAFIQNDNGKFHLTERQQEVLGIMCQGKTNKEIGRLLGLSEGTIRSHLHAIFRILGANNRHEAAYMATQLGIFSVKHGK